MDANTTTDTFTTSNTDTSTSSSSILQTTTLDGHQPTTTNGEFTKNAVPSDETVKTLSSIYLNGLGEQTQSIANGGYNGNTVSSTIIPNGETKTSSSGLQNTSDEQTQPTASSEIINGAASSVSASSDTVLKERPQPTANGGHSHTTSSKAKISQANKGKTPWNKGRKRSEEEKARISAGVRAKNRERLLKKLEEEGITEEEHNARIAEAKKKAADERKERRTAKGGYIPTEETKAKISKALRAKYKDGDLRKRRSSTSNQNRKGIKHTEETKKKISASLKARWNEDPDYKTNMKNKLGDSNKKETVRERISNTLKEKWKDPEFRAYMMEKIANRRAAPSTRGDDYRRKISESMKRKWEDPNYRAKAVKGMSNAAKGRVESTTDSPQKKPKKKPVVKKTKEKTTSTSIKKDTTKSEKPKISITPVPMLTKVPVATPGVVKKKRRRKSTSSSTSTPTSKTPVKKKKPVLSKFGENEEEKKRLTRMKDQRRDLYDLLYGEEERAEQKSNLDKTQDNTSDDDNIHDIQNNIEFEAKTYIEMFGDADDEEDDFDIEEFDPYGLDELEQSRF